MSFLETRPRFEQELDTHYALYPTDVSDAERHMDAVSARHPEWSSFRRKALLYETGVERCRVKVFRHFPFYFELDTGRMRTDLGAGGMGGWLKRQPFGLRLAQQGQQWWAPCAGSGLSYGWPVLDDNHHGMGIDNVFRWGLGGLLGRAQERLTTADGGDERDFLGAMCSGLRAQIALAGRFADQAESLLGKERDDEVRRRLARIAETAPRVPAEPPGTFFEALNTILFIRETTQSLEGNGISILGHLDRVLDPYYRADLAAGRITREEAKDLLCFFLAFSDVRFGMRQMRDHVGANTTVVIGGCDAAGVPVFNDLTRMVAEVYDELRLVDPKLHARVGAGHPREYFDQIGDLISRGGNSVCVFNDDVLIPANVRMGKAVADCRLYVGGGCQENVLENTEVNSRATMYLNLLKVFLAGFFPERLGPFVAREEIELETYSGCETFGALSSAFLANLRAVLGAHVVGRNRSEAQGRLYNPCPLHSAMMDDCIEKARDMLDGGTRYSFGSVSLVGIGTLIDSLFAVREAVYNRALVTLDELAGMLAKDFEGSEPFRCYLVNRIAKFGQDDGAVRAFSAEVFADLARVSSGWPNSRGGRYEASLFSFRSFTDLGVRTGATPDGRNAGEHLSAGMSPSLLGLGRSCTAGQVLDAIEPLDLTLYPVVAVLDVRMPACRQTPGDVLTPVIRRFVAAGGSVLQINCVDTDTLLDARAHPSRHPDLVVRISGYSAYFNTLSAALQDEIIERTIVSP